MTTYSKIEMPDRNVIVLKPPYRRSFMEKLRVKWRFESEFYTGISKRIACAVQTLVQENGIELFHMEETHGWAATVIRTVKIPVVVQLCGPWFIHRDLSPTERNKPKIAVALNGRVRPFAVPLPSELNPQAYFS